MAKEFGEAACIGETIEVNGVTLPYRPACADSFSGITRHKHSFLNNWSVMSLNALIGAANSVGGFIGFGTVCHGWADDNARVGPTATRMPRGAWMCGSPTV